MNRAKQSNQQNCQSNMVKRKRVPKPPFEGSVPRRDQIDYETPTFLPSLQNRLTLAWRGHPYYLDQRGSESHLCWRCALQSCSGRVRMMRIFPLNVANLIKSSATPHSPHCTPSQTDVFARRAAVRWMCLMSQMLGKRGRIHGHQLRTGGQGRKCAFSHFSNRSLRTDGPTDRRTKPLIDLRVRN